MSARGPAAFALLVLTGCAQVLGLDETRFEGSPDADIDAPGVCDGLPAACMSTTGRSICGQLYAPGGAPIRTEGAEPAACEPNGAGPCAYSVTAIAYSDYTTAAPGPLLGAIDTCGRWVVNDVEPSIARVAVLFDAPAHIQTATLVTVDTTKSDAVVGQAAYAVSQDQLVTWGAQAGVSEGPLTSTGFLVSYRIGGTAPGIPSEGVTFVQNNMSPPATPNPVGSVPWAVYFGGDMPFGSVDPALAKTGPSGTALTVTDVFGAFELEGIRTTGGGGARCEVLDLHQVAGALIHLSILRC